MEAKNKMMTRFLEVVEDSGIEPKISDYYISAPCAISDYLFGDLYELKAGGNFVSEK